MDGNPKQFSKQLTFSLHLALWHEMVKVNKQITFRQDPGPVDSCVIIASVNLCAYFAPFFNL